VAPDPSGGRWIFRRPWQGAGDSLVVLNLRSNVIGGCHYNRSGRTWDMQLFALGRQWVGDKRFTEKPGAGAALPTVSNAGAFNDRLGPKVTHWDTPADGMASLSLDMDPVYMQWLARGAEPPAGLKTASLQRLGTFADHGVRARRFVAVDLSGQCGAPVLLVVIDRTAGAKDLTWNLKLARAAGAARTEGNTITVGEPAGANLKCTFIAPGDPKLTGAIRATGGDEYFAIITVQNGAAPAIKVDGEGLSARVSVGGRRIHFDGEKIHLRD
jgi:hypothetical protein